MKKTFINLNKYKFIVYKFLLGFKIQGDTTLWFIIFFLNILSLPLVYSSISKLAYSSTGEIDHLIYIFKQFSQVMLGLGLIYFFHLVNYNVWKKFSTFLYLFSLFLLIYSKFYGIEKNNAIRSIYIPFTNLTLQVFDLVRLILIIIMSKILSLHIERIKDSRFILKKISILLLPLFILVFLENLSSAIIILGLGVNLLFIAGFPIKEMVKYLILSLLVISIAIFIMYQFKYKRAETWIHRLKSLTENINIKADIKEKIDYSQLKLQQKDYSKIAVATGGLIGLGPGNSIQKNSLPQAYSDYIYAIVIEEYGLLGGIFLIIFFLAFFYRCVKIAISVKDYFAKFLVFGCAINIIFQVVVNMGVSVSLDFMPVTGQNLPFLSMGGTSMFIYSISIGIILCVSKSVYQPNNNILENEKSKK